MTWVWLARLVIHSNYNQMYILLIDLQVFSEFKRGMHTKNQECL